MAENEKDVAPAAPQDEQRKAELERLFREWDQRRAEEIDLEPFGDDDEAPLRPPPIIWRLVFAVVVFTAAALLLLNTHLEFAYYLEDGAPIDLGNMAERYRQVMAEKTERKAAGEADVDLCNHRLDAQSNSYVKMEGLFFTHEMYGASKEEEKNLLGDPFKDETIRKYFLDPAFSVVVRTTQALPDKVRRNVEIESDFLPIIGCRRAFPSDLTVTVAMQGRLIKASDAPRFAQPAVNSFQESARLASDEVWVLIDGDRPSDYQNYAILWGFALAAPIMPGVLLLLALRRRKRWMRGLGAGKTPAT